jgi:catechol 2,3-dioxygenase-like lactoylglutathione lyase family enzyme
MIITGLDHLVLTVASIKRTSAFYERVLGMQVETFAGGSRTALKFGDQKINLHEAGKEFEPKAASATPGSGDLCFVVDDVTEAKARLEGESVELIDGPIPRTGARGPILSVYCRDPDGNLIELSQYE